jgi:hypothetical protein
MTWKKNTKFEMFMPKIFGLFLFVILLLAYNQILAIGSPYTPGATLDPACSPGSTNCFVQMFPDQSSNSGKYLVTNGSSLSWSTVNQSQWTSGGSDIYYTTGNVGIGTSSPTTPLDVNGEIRAKNLTIDGESIILEAPTNISAIQTCASGCGYFAENWARNYRIYSYKNVGPSRIYSSSYLTLPSNFIDDFSENNYDITVSWNAAVGADGYRVLKYDNYLGYNFNAGYDVTNTSFIDDGCSSSCFSTLNASVISTTTYSNTATINGIFNLSGPMIMKSSTIKADTNHNFSIGENNTLAESNNFFVGNSAGVSVGSGTNNSNFIGAYAGAYTANAIGSNFFGGYSGYGADNASASNFFGGNAGWGSTNAQQSNFIGAEAGESAPEARNSNFFGTLAGSGATNAGYSNFFGLQTGSGASNASFSNLFGYRAGYTFTSNNIGSNNIIIGTNISLPNSTSNAINIGGILFGTGTYGTIINGDHPSIIPASGGKIGIGVVTPSYTLQVGNSSISGIVARFQNSSGTCDINPTSASLSCSSDETLKKNITPVIPGILNKVLLLNPVTYNWNSELDSDQIHTGFVAQQVEAIFPDLVATDNTTGLKSLNYVGLTPYVVKALQEIDLKVDTLTSLDLNNSSSLGSLIKQFLSDQALLFKEATVGVLHINDQVCVDDVCATKEQFKALLLQAKNLPQTSSSDSNNQNIQIDNQNSVDTSSSDQTTTDTSSTPDTSNILPEQGQ